MNFTEGQEVHFGNFKVTVEEVDEYNSRYLVSVNKNGVSWTGWVDEALLTEEKSEKDDYPWED